MMYCTVPLPCPLPLPTATFLISAAWFWPWESCGWWWQRPAAGWQQAKWVHGGTCAVSGAPAAVGAALLLLRLVAVGAALLLLVAVGAALLLLVVGAALLLLLAADGRGAALHLAAAGAESQQYDTHACPTKISFSSNFNALTSRIVFSNDPAFAHQCFRNQCICTNLTYCCTGRSCNNLLS